MTFQDEKNISIIEGFLTENEIPFVKSIINITLSDGSETDEVIFNINNNSIQLRYVNTLSHLMDYSKRFGIIGLPHNYFINISKENHKNNIRTIWIKDFEINENSTIVDIDGNVLENYHRKWEVLKGYVLTAVGKIKNRIYARDCEVREVSNSELRPFLNTNCFYGYRSANKNLGLYLKKDKNGLKKGTLVFVYTFGYNFYGNKNRQDNPFIEIIRVSTLIGTQVIGGASKLLKHFLLEYPVLKINNRDIEVKELKFYVDADHNSGKSLETLGFTFESWDGYGFMNMWTCDYDDNQGLKGSANEIFHRKPMFHKKIMELMKEHKIVSIANAGTIVYSLDKENYLKQFS